MTQKYEFVIGDEKSTEEGRTLKRIRALMLTRGCFRGSVDEFLAQSRKKHDSKTHREYKLLIQAAQSRILKKEAS